MPKSNTLRYVAVGAVVAGALAGAYWWLSTSPILPHAQPDMANAAGDGEQGAPGIAQPGEMGVQAPHALPKGASLKSHRRQPYHSRFGPLPESLKGTEPPAGLVVDAAGNLVPTPLLMDVFDYFLTLVGEEPLDQVAERVLEYMGQQLDEVALAQATEVFEHYLSMKQALIESGQLMAEQAKLEGRAVDYEALLRSSQAIRRQHLGNTWYDAFYAEQDKMDEYALQKLAVARDASLTAEEKAQRVTSLEALLPEAARTRREENRALDTLANDVASARASGASEAQIHQMRVEAMGAEKAERFRDADQKRFVWEDRLTQYRKERAQVLSSDALSVSDKTRAIQTLREQYFTGNELRRIPVIDRMKDAEGPSALEAPSQDEVK